MSDALLQRIQEQASQWAKTGAKFVDDSVLESLETISDDELNSLDYGAVLLNDNGDIQKFNKVESERSGVAVADALGKSFFTYIAPCTNNAIFLGSFKQGVEKGEMDYIFPYTFTYKMKPTPVKVHLYRRAGSSKNWLFVKWP